jgi:hypothetical protein
VELVEIWLRDKCYFITFKGRNSFIGMSNIGTIQDQSLDHSSMQYSTPQLTPFHVFADDIQAITTAKTTKKLGTNMQIKFEILMKWLKHSCLIVNETKTELAWSTKPITNQLK